MDAKSGKNSTKRCTCEETLRGQPSIPDTCRATIGKSEINIIFIIIARQQIEEKLERKF